MEDLYQVWRATYMITDYFWSLKWDCPYKWNTNFWVFGCTAWFNFSITFSFVSEHHPVLVWKAVDVHRFKSKQIFGGAKDICPNFPNLPITFCGTLPTRFLLKGQRSWKRFLVRPPNKGLYVFFWKCWVPFFEIKERWATFSAILLEYLTN